MIYLFSRAPVVADLAAGMARGPNVGADGLQGIENLWGTSYSDLLVGDDSSATGFWDGGAGTRWSAPGATTSWTAESKSIGSTAAPVTYAL